MNRWSLVVAPLALLACASAPASAGPILWNNDIAWSYRSAPSPTTIPADWVAYPLSGTAIWWPPPWPPPFSGQGSLHLSDGPVHHLTGSTDIIATRVWATSQAPKWFPAQFTNAAYRLSLILTDQASGKSGVVTFRGLFNGSLWAHGANISNRFIGPLSQTLILGLDVYTVTIGPYLPPGPHGWWDAGAIGAHVDVHFLEPPPWILDAQELASSAPATVHSPEPSSLSLAALGLSGLGLVVWRRRRGSAYRGRLSPATV